MKKSIILLLVLLPIVAFSQMQQIISQGNTTATKRIINVNQIGIDYDLIKIRSIDTNRLIISLPPNNNNGNTFLYTLVGGTTNLIRSVLNGVKMYDFQVYNGNIYFCGTYNNEGCIGWTSINNLILPNPQPITLKIINNPISTIKITEIEVYNYNNAIYVAAIADDKYLIELNTLNQNFYQIMETNTGEFKKLSAVNNKLILLEHLNDTSFTIAAFDKSFLQNYIYKSFIHPDLSFDNYVLENLILGTNLFTLAYTHRKPTVYNNYYKTDFAIFDIGNDITIINNQCLEISDAKLWPIDLEYCPEDTVLLYLAGGHNGYDEIFQIKPFVNSTYISNSIQPYPHINKGIKQYNSLIKYDNYFFATIAKNNLNSIIIFDCNRGITPSNCAYSFQETIQNYNYLTPNTINVSYTYTTGVQTTVSTTVSFYLDSYQITCP